jgi:Tfp pilus assembly protein PilN
MIEINLLPGAGRKSRSRGASRLKLPGLPSFGGGGGLLADRWLLAAIASGLLAIGAVAFLYVTQSRREAELADAQERATQDSTRYASVLAERVKAEATRDTVLRQLAVIRSIDDDRFIWPHILDEISRALPPFTWLQSVAFSGTAQGANNAKIVGAVSDTAKKDTTAKALPPGTVARDTVRLRLQGQTVDLQALTRFMRDLENSPFIERVALEKSELVVQDGKEVTQFSLDAYYSRPDSASVRRQPLVVSGR